MEANINYRKSEYNKYSNRTFSKIVTSNFLSKLIILE